LNDVLFVPELSQNLLSVSAIVKNGGKVDFARNKAEIKKIWKNVYGVQNQARSVGSRFWKTSEATCTAD